ncbi:S9 family peptidase [Candidatus Bathyarchaeota archaeon]|nr:MAG: S9 family peptidase [Candidatus Bathyarchaeota archaeon]
MSSALVLAPRFERVKQVFEIPDLELLDVSKDGETALVLSNNTGSYQLFSVPVKGGDLKQVSHGKERVSWASMSSDSEWVAFSRDEGGKEQHQIYKARLDSGAEEQQLTQLPPNRILDFNWSSRADRIAFAGSTKEFNGIWVIETKTGKATEIYRQKHWLFGPEWTSDDSWLVFSAKTTEAPTAMELIFKGMNPHSSPIVYTPKPGSENTRAQWNPHNSSLVLFKTDAQDRYDLAIYDRDKSRLSYLKAGQENFGLDFPIFGWMPDGKEVFYLGTKEGRTRLYIEEVEGGKSPREIKIPEGYHAGFSNQCLKVRKDDQVVFSSSSLSKPPSLTKSNLKTGTTTSIFEHSTKLPLGRAEHVVYKSFDDRPIHGWFLTPSDQKGRRPCVLVIHGGPAWEVADTWTPAIQSFLLAGYPVFAPNIRGSTGYGADFEKLNVLDIGGADLRDVEEAAKYLRKRVDVDPAKIALVGASYGGYMTFLGLTKKPEYWAAGAAIVGITDWKEMYDLSDAIFRSFIERYFGTPEENPELYHERSPIHYVENIRAPLLIWHRGNDSRCPLGPVEKFASKLKEQGKKYEMTVVWDEGHGFQKRENLIRQYKGVIEFLDRQLGTPTA